MHPGESHMRAFLTEVGALPGGELHETGDALWCLTGVEWPMFNGGIGGDPDSVTEAVRILDPETGPAFFWWSTDERSTSLSGLCNDLGLTVFDANAPWMQAQIADLPEPELPVGGEIVEVNDEHSHREWCDTLVRAFGFPPEGGDRWFEVGKLGGFDGLPWRQWTARHEGVPVGITLSYNGGGIAGLFGMAVVPEARRMGYGAYLTLMPLHVAADEGESIAGFFSTDEGYPLYESLGFTTQGSMTRWLGGRSPFA